MRVSTNYVALLFLLPLYGVSQIGGQTSLSFLNVPVSARSASMGGVSIAVKDNDVNQFIQNPSLLNEAMNNKLAFSFINYFTNIKSGNFVYARKIDKLKGSFGANMQFMDYGKFIRTDETGAILGQFYASDYMLGLSYSRSLKDTNFSFGATLKNIYSVYETYTSFSNAIDFGAYYNYPAKLVTATIVMRNFGKQWKSFVPGNKESIPYELQIGISKRLSKAPFRFSLIGQQLQKWDLTYNDPSNPEPTIDPLTGQKIEKSKLSIFGSKLMHHIVFSTEILFTKNFYLNIGYNHLRRSELKLDTRSGITGFSFGAGIKISKFNLSYGRAQYHLAGASNHLSIVVNLSDFGGKKTQTN